SFRGKDGLWKKYDPKFLDIGYFHDYPEESWKIIKEIFYDFFGQAQPNPAHIAVSELEALGKVKTVITQNIDNLHQMAGSQNVLEFHGNSSYLLCTECGARYKRSGISLDQLPPLCTKCNGLLKPDFIFFGEGIPEPANSLSFMEADKADVFLIIGTTGEVMPACMIPQLAKKKGAFIIEVNPEHSLYTKPVTDIFLQGPAGVILNALVSFVKE
ncbi:MAG: Sir2 family NAD-dependent protein deacetylase, partial [Bacteroidota bacterium]